MGDKIKEILIDVYQIDGRLEDEATERILRLFAVSGSLPLTLKPTNKLERGDVFLWRSGRNGRYEIHTFHSDAGYGVKTFTNYNEKDGSSMLVNWSGVCGVLEGNEA